MEECRRFFFKRGAKFSAPSIREGVASKWQFRKEVDEKSRRANPDPPGALIGRSDHRTMQHIGMGVPLRAAEHARLRTEREAEEAAIELPDEAEREEVAAEQVLATINNLSYECSWQKHRARRRVHAQVTLRFVYVKLN